MNLKGHNSRLMQWFRREITCTGIRIKIEGMRCVEIIFWRESQKWEGPERAGRFLCETGNEQGDVGDIVIHIVHVKVGMPMTHL